MKLHELFEYQLFKTDAGFKIYRNPSANDIRLLLKNSYILSKLDIDLTSDIDDLDTMDDEYIHYGGQIHGLDYPLRGVVIDNTVYIVDSYDADHDELRRTLRNQGLDVDESIAIAIEKQSTTPRNDLEDYGITGPQAYVSTLKNIQTVTRMRMPIVGWN